MELEINKEWNKQNIKTFEVYGAFRGANKKIYRCCVCGSHTSILKSTSIEGAFLLCNECMHKHFKMRYEDVRDWQLEMLRGK